MSEACTNDCKNCQSDCADRRFEDFREKPHELSDIKKVIGVVSGKGGVGKTLVTNLLAVNLQRRGYKTAILDADITGPSVPRAFHIDGKAEPTELGILPKKSKTGISIISSNMFLAHDTDPVVWRGPMIAGMVKQFWTDVVWGDVDYMFVDMPPGTGDVPLTVFQSIPLSGVVVVTSPQELVSMIVKKAVKMAGMMNIPILGIVENMSYVTCPGCGEKIYPFGQSKVEAMAKEYGISTTDSLGMDPLLAEASDKGAIELCENGLLDKTVEKILSL